MAIWQVDFPNCYARGNGPDYRVPLHRFFRSGRLANSRPLGFRDDSLLFLRIPIWRLLSARFPTTRAFPSLCPAESISTYLQNCIAICLRLCSHPSLRDDDNHYKPVPILESSFTLTIRLHFHITYHLHQCQRSIEPIHHRENVVSDSK
jgi:hypothetical protein